MWGRGCEDGKAEKAQRDGRESRGGSVTTTKPGI